jgi:uncharacterized protein DUF3147
MQRGLLEQDDREPVGFDWSKITKVKPGEVAIRFVFGAIVALAAGVTGVLAGPKVGGLFLAFPAILPASLTLIEKKEGIAKAWSDASGGAIGAIGMAAFALTTILLLPVNPALALLLALVAWIVVSTGLYFLIRASGLFLAWDRLFSDTN